MLSYLNKKVLVVDDSQTMRLFIIFQLVKLLPGVEIVEAEDGYDALVKLNHFEVDLILTDMNMPKLSGAEVIRSVRTVLNKATPIIVITTKGEQPDREQGLALGANGYITKPINPSEFRETILKCLT